MAGRAAAAWILAAGLLGAALSAAEPHGAPVPEAAAAGDGAAGGHGAEAEQVNPSPLTVDPDLALFTGLVFLLLVAFLGKFAWRPMMEGLERRERTIASQLEEARRNAERAQESARRYEARLAAAQEEVSRMLAEARREADAARERLLAEAREAAQRERDRAVADIAAARNEAVVRLAERGAELAVSLAGKIVRRELRPEDHARLIQESLERLPKAN